MYLFFFDQKNKDLGWERLCIQWRRRKKVKVSFLLIDFPSFTLSKVEWVSLWLMFFDKHYQDKYLNAFFATKHFIWRQFGFIVYKTNKQPKNLNKINKEGKSLYIFIVCIYGTKWWLWVIYKITQKQKIKFKKVLHRSIPVKNQMRIRPKKYPTKTQKKETWININLQQYNLINYSS